MRYAQGTLAPSASFACVDDFLDQFPDTLPIPEIVATNNVSSDIHTQRRFEWNGWTFDIPPGVFRPGPTSQILFQAMLDGLIDVRGRRYLAMGAGLGVEAVVAASLGAREICVVDIDPASVEAADRHVRELAGTPEPEYTSFVSDLWAECPQVSSEVITFNPPFIDVTLTSDRTVTRNIAIGLPLAKRFFAELARSERLSCDGQLFMLLSNTTPLKEILRLALDVGLEARVVSHREWSGENVVTFLLAFTWPRPAPNKSVMNSYGG